MDWIHLNRLKGLNFDSSKLSRQQTVIKFCRSRPIVSSISSLMLLLINEWVIVFSPYSQGFATAVSTSSSWIAKNLLNFCCKNEWSGCWKENDEVKLRCCFLVQVLGQSNSWPAKSRSPNTNHPHKAVDSSLCPKLIVKLHNTFFLLNRDLYRVAYFVFIIYVVICFRVKPPYK